MKKTLRITVNGKVYDVTAEILGEETGAPPVARAAAGVATAAPAVAPAPAPTPQMATPPAGGSGAILSPLAGKVVSVDVKVGDSIAAGAQVATLEAMKMNTFIYAEQAGKVTAVLVTAGDAVEEGAALLQLG